MRKIILGLMVLTMMTSVLGAVNLTANVGNEAPTVGDIQVCDGTCGYAKSIDPATQFTVQVTIIDPNGAGDLNLETAKLEFYKGSDANGSGDDWDAITLDGVTTGTRDGCTQTGDVYCLQVETSDWTTKFLAGVSDVYVYIEDGSSAMDSNESVGVLTINSNVSHTEDATTGAYSGSPNSTENAILTSEANAYIITIHTGNVDMNVDVTATQLDKGGDNIPVENQKWYLSDDYGSSSAFTGGADVVKSDYARGTDPTSATQNIFYWLDIPADQESGEYTGTITYSSIAS